MEANAPDSDPLTFEEEFEACIHSQDEGSQGAEAVGTRKLGRQVNNSLKHFTVEEFSEKYPGCFSMEYQVDVFDGVDHSAYINKLSPTNLPAKNALQPSVSSFRGRHNQDITKENGHLLQHTDLLYDSQKNLKKGKNYSQLCSPRNSLETCEEHPAPGTEASLNKSASCAFTATNGANGLKYSCSYSNSNEWRVSEIEQKENILTAKERNSFGNLQVSTINLPVSKAGCSDENNLTEARDSCHLLYHKLCNKVFRKRVSPKKLLENQLLQNRKDKCFKSNAVDIHQISHISQSCDQKTNFPGLESPKDISMPSKDALSQDREQGRRRSAPPLLGSLNSKLSATLCSPEASDVDMVEGSLPYKSSDHNWQVTWNVESVCEKKSDSSWQISDISEPGYWREKSLTQPSPFGTLEKQSEAGSWRKAPKRSLDWPPARNTSSEALRQPSKYLDVTTLSWRTSPKSSNASISRFFQDRKIKADFDDKELVVKSFDPGFIDTHCHIDFLFERIKHSGSYSEFRKDTKDPFPLSYEGCVTIFCKPWTFSKINWWETIIEEEGIWAAFGCHPHFADQFGFEEEVYLQAALLKSKTLALGEIGLDYHKKNEDLFATQREVFRKQLKIAVNMKKPVVIHCRDAHRDCIDIMKEILPLNYQIHLHCFTGTWRQAEEWLEAFSGLFLGITNLINNSSDLRNYGLQMAVKKIPLQRLLLETDAPYFRPPFLQGGQHSHPGMALYVAAKVAHLKGKEVEVVLAQTRINTRLMYGI